MPPPPPCTPSEREGLWGEEGECGGHRGPRRLPGAESLMRAASAKCTGQPDVVAPAYFITDQTLVGSCCELVAVSAAAAALTASDAPPRETKRPSWLLLLTYFSGFACVCVRVCVTKINKHFRLPRATVLLSITHSPVCPPTPSAPLLRLYFLYHTLVFSPVPPPFSPPLPPRPPSTPPSPYLCRVMISQTACFVSLLCLAETQSEHL